MKKFATILVAVVVLMPSVLFASTATSTSNGDPMMITQVWGLSGYQTPIMAPGSSVIDRGGVVRECGKDWKTGCFDTPKTPYYENGMLSLARELISKGIADKFQRFAGWVSIVRLGK